MPSDLAEGRRSQFSKERVEMRITTTWLLAITLVTSPQFAQADGSAVATPAEKETALQLKNVELSASGQLVGQYVTATGSPIAEQELSVTIGTQKQTISTDRMGRFAAKVATGGRCVIGVGDDVYACRVWTNGTAPPKSLKSVAIVQESEATARGQFGRFGTFNPTARLMMLSTRQKVILAALVGAGVGVAISEATQDDDVKKDAS